MGFGVFPWKTASTFLWDTSMQNQCYPPCGLLVLNWQPGALHVLFKLSGHYDGTYVFIVEFEVRLIPLSIRQLKVISLEQEKKKFGVCSLGHTRLICSVMFCSRPILYKKYYSVHGYVLSLKRGSK